MYRPDPNNDGEMLGCPASVRLGQGAPDTTSYFAAEGTAAHWISEICRNEEKPASEYLGYTDGEMLDPDGNHIKCDQEMVDGVQYFLDYVNAIPHTVAFYEIKVTYMQWVEDDGFGTLDDIRIDEDLGVVHITDLKYGKGIQVYAENSIQLMLYALGVYEMYGDLYDFDKFVLAICQPRLDHIDEWEISLTELLEWANTVVRPAAELTREEDAPINAGSWCRWCPIKARCRTRANWILKISHIDDLMDNSDIATVLPHLDTIRGWCNEVEEVALSEVQKGSYVGGYYLSEGRSDRKWRDPEAVVKAMRNYKFRVTDIYEKKLVTPAKFEKLPGAGKEHPVLKRHVEKPRGKPKLTPPWVDKPKFGPDAKEEFDDISDDFADFEGGDLLE